MSSGAPASSAAWYRIAAVSQVHLKRAGMRADDDGVAGLEGDQRLVDGGGSGIGGGQNGRHHAHRHADFDDLFFGQFAQDADGLHAAHAARQPVAVQQILDVLVFGVAVAGLFDGQIGQAFGIGARRRGHALDDGVHLLLGIRAVLLPGGVRLLDLGADLLDRQEVFIFEHRPVTSCCCRWGGSSRPPHAGGESRGRSPVRRRGGQRPRPRPSQP